MSRGRRYNNEPRLNIKKVIAVFIVLLVMVTFFIAIKNLLHSDSSSHHLISRTYFVYNKDNKWGVIDHNAKVVIEPIYENAIIIPNAQKAVFICVDSAKNDQTQAYTTKVLNEKGDEILTGYESIMALENYDENYNLWYEENVLLVKKNGKYGLINFEGKVLLDPIYDSISPLKGTKNSIIIEQNGKKGLVNDAGTVIIETKYDNIESLGKDGKAYIVKSDKLYGVYGLLDCKYQEIKPMNSLNAFCVKENNTYQVIDKEGNILLNEKFDKIEAIQENYIVYQYNQKYSAYNFQEKKKLNTFYKELIYTANDLFIFKTANNYGIVDIDGRVLLEDEYTSIQYYEKADIYELEKKEKEDNSICNRHLEEFAIGTISEVNYDKSYIKVWTEEGYTYYNINGEKITAQEALPSNNLFLSKQNGKYGLIDKDGNLVVDYYYDDAKEQTIYGYIAVKKDGLWGCLDKTGKSICDTKYNLDNQLFIDFIGEYHTGEDINFIYYTNQ